MIRLDIQRFVAGKEDLPGFIEDIQLSVLEELRYEFPECRGLDGVRRLSAALDRIFAQTGQSFLFIIDEWDCIFRIAREDVERQKEYLDFLRGLFKGAVYAELVYMTGILPIKKYGEHSAINMFTEYSMTDPKNLCEYFGFTEEEVREQCRKRSADYGSMAKWYDGYLLGSTHIYNPKSVVDALLWGEYQNYWTGTETYEALKIYIERNFDGLKEAVVTMLGGGRCRVDTTSFQNDMTTFRSRDDILTLLVSLGYLTYDRKTGEVLIPNREVQEEFVRALRNAEGWEGLTRSLDRSLELLKKTWAMDEAAVAAGIEEIHSETTSILQYHNENSLACVLYIAYYSASAYYMKPIAELPTGKGFADLVYLPLCEADRPALVVGLKWNASAEGAIRQIKEKKYVAWVEGYTGEILLIGISYDKKTKRHQCRIESYQKDGEADS